MAREGEEILKDLADGVLNLDEELAVRAAHEAVAAASTRSTPSATAW